MSEHRRTQCTITHVLCKYILECEPITYQHGVEDTNNGDNRSDVMQIKATYCNKKTLINKKCNQSTELLHYFLFIRGIILIHYRQDNSAER